MSASTLITTYLGSGLAASRPTSPAIPTGGLGLWYSTDTGVSSIYDGSWVALVGSKHVFIPAGGNAAVYSASALAFATQGHCISVMENLTFDEVYLGAITTGSSQTWSCSVAVINSSGVIQSILASANVTTFAGTGNTTMKFDFTGAPVTLIAGTLYAILFTNQSASTTTTAIPVMQTNTAGGQWIGAPVDFSQLNGVVNIQEIAQLAAKTLPLTGTLTFSPTVRAINATLRAQV